MALAHSDFASTLRRIGDRSLWSRLGNGQVGNLPHCADGGSD